MDGGIVALFCDGGLIGRNPSPVGGTWAFCAVTKEGEHVREVSAYLLPNNTICPGNPRIGSDSVTNNDTEFYAALRALEGMKDGWAGMLATDSRVTIERLQKCRLGQVPTAFRIDWYGRALAAFKRLGDVKLVQLAGHPTMQQLADGEKKKSDGTTAKVNRHQVWCDEECTRRAKTFDEHMKGWVQAGLLKQEQLEGMHAA